MYGTEKKKSTRQELTRKEKKKLAERERKKRIKNDPILYAALKEKDKQRYCRLKEEGKIVSMAELTPRDRRIRRKQNRLSYEKYRNKAKLTKNTEVEPFFIEP